MSQVPLLREVVTGLGGFPLDHPTQRKKHFFQQAIKLLEAHQLFGVFPKGAAPMIKFTPTNFIGDCQRGFAHLALGAPVSNLAILPDN
ncbi:hypothetical protein [Dapis sp. BLCC M172]|uniref:hypothetical protein n=1 Tax=Dapis sp. BLCC M172 TaxID=2975281 RepID=UPI003CEA9C01